MYDAASTDFHDPPVSISPTKTWVNTGVVIDDRPGSRQDALWDGTHLYVSSHIFSLSPASGQSGARSRASATTAAPRRTRWTQAFPSRSTTTGPRSLVIDKDSTGKLWATWTQGNKVWVSHTTTSDTAWTTPFVPPVPGHLAGLG